MPPYILAASCCFLAKIKGKIGMRFQDMKIIRKSGHRFLLRNKNLGSAAKYFGSDFKILAEHRAKEIRSPPSIILRYKFWAFAKRAQNEYLAK